tara:strand:- start:74 stop:4762 length:4689 start_codon:yes stop_codon:yes gene_type:complete
MDTLNIQGGNTNSNEDTTFELEGYEEHMENLDNQYKDDSQWQPPAETEAEVETAQPAVQQPTEHPRHQAFQELDIPSDRQPQAVDQTTTEGQPQDQQVQQVDQEQESTGNKLFDRGIARQNRNWRYDENGDILIETLTDGEERRLIDLPNGAEKIKVNSLTKTFIHEKEKEVIRLLSSANLENKLLAFEMISQDQELVDRYDRNKDGKMTYADFFDTTNLNYGDGMSEEEDAIATAEWLAGLQAKDSGSRARAIWQKYGAGQDMVLYTAKVREGYFDPTAEENWKSSGGGAWFDIGAILAETGGSFRDIADGAAEGDWNVWKNWHKDSKYDDDLLQHKNPLSLEWQVNNPIAITENSRDIYATTFWSTALAGTVGTGAVIAPLAKTSAVAAKVIGSAKTVKGAIVADTIAPGLFRDFTEDGIGMMRQKGPIEWMNTNLGSEGEVVVPSIANGMNNPWAKKIDNTILEGGLAWGSARVIGFLGRNIFGKTGFLRQGLPNGVRRAQTNLDQFRMGARDWSTKKYSEMISEESLFRKGQQQLNDIYEAGVEQARKTGDSFKNAFSTDGATQADLFNGYGVYKNGGFLGGQGWTKARSGVRQVLNDLDQIRHRIGLRVKGGTDSLFSQVELARAAKSGISPGQLDLFAKDFVEDNILSRQLDELNPLKGKYTRRYSSDSAQQSIQELMGRDAGAMSQDEFWGSKFLDREFKIGDYNNLDSFNKWAVREIEVADAVNESLLLQLRDAANSASEMVGKTDLFAVDGPVSRIADNLKVGLSQVKKTQYTWDKARELLKNSKTGTLTQAQLDELTADVALRSRSMDTEIKQGINHMVNMLRKEGNDDLAAAVLDVFKVSNDVHNWKDFDAWMRQKIKGGEFQGKVKTGALIRELQGVMVNSILSGPKTPLRAILGTTTNAYLNAINEAAGAVLRAPFTNDVVTRKASIAKLKGMFELVPEAFDVFKQNWDAKFNADFADIRTRYSEPPTKGDNLWAAQGRWVEARGTDGDKAAYNITNIARTLNNNKLLGWSPRVLAATDDTFKWLMTRARSKELAMREVLEGAGDDVVEFTPQILKAAEDRHYANMLDGFGEIDVSKNSWLNKQFKEVTLTSELTGFAQKLDSLMNETPLLKPFYLFARTGINGLNLSFKNTPLLGALHKESLAILRHTGDNFDDLARYGIENANDLKNARNLLAGRQAVGSATVMTMAGMYTAGQLTGNGPADRSLRQQWINAGWKPNHVYIGNVGFDYRSLEPFNVIWSSIADIGDNIELMGPEWAEQRLQAVAFVIGRGLTGKTYMSGLDQMMQIMQKPLGPETQKVFANIMNNSVPLAGMRNEFGKWVNPHMKELNSDMWTSIRNRNQATEFLAGEGKLPNKSDLLNGTPINNWNIIGRSFNAVSPISMDIRRRTPGRKLLLSSGYDLKSATYSYGGYSFSKDAHVRAHFQNAIGTVPVTVGFKKFKNVEEALDYIATRKDIKISMQQMQADSKSPANKDLNPNNYPHNTVIDRLMNQARSKAWAKINDPKHPGYDRVQALKSKKDGHTNRTRDSRSEILELSFPSKQIEQFPKN